MAVESLTDQDRATARRTLLWDGVFSRVMDTLTGGVFLAGLGLFLGADNFTIGVLASLPFFAQVAQLGAVKLLLHVTHRRKIVVVTTALMRLLLAALAVLIMLRGAALGAPTLVAFMAVIALLAVIAAAAWNWWVRDVIERDQLGRYFGMRMRWTTLTAAATLLGAGVLLDYFVDRDQTAVGYGILFSAAALFGIVSTLFLALTPHPYPKVAERRGRVLPLMMGVLRNEPNRRLVLALSLTAATLTIALPFTAVYMLRSLEYSFVTVTVLALISQLAYVGSLKGWGHLSDRFGNQPILRISIGILVAALLGWSVAWADHGLGLLVLLGSLHFLSGFAIGGIELTAGNILLKTAPENDAPAYLATLSLTRAVAAGVATLAAGAAWQGLGSGALLVFRAAAEAPWILRGFHLLSLASAGVGILAIFALRRVREEGGAPVAEVAIAMRREVNVLSSVAGIRAFVHVVSYVVEFMAQPAPSRLPRLPGRRNRRPPDEPAKP
jgi:MFS family permease